jgi:hypothetical protein
MNADELALEVAAKLADGEQIDWTDVERRIGRRRIPIGPFRALETIARAYRSLMTALTAHP